MNFIFFGFKSCGKTHMARYLASQLRRVHFDTDHLIEQHYAEEYKESLSCRSISLKIGEAGFRALEKKIIYSLKTIPEIQNNAAILSVGGGAVLDPENRSQLSTLGQLIYLQISKEALKQRLLGNPEGLPSFLDPQDPEGSFERMYRERKAIYESISVYRI
jgi:shikimate kinase